MDRESGVLPVAQSQDPHWCNLVGCELVCECGATCEDHMEDRTACPTFMELEAEFDLAANGE